MDFLNPVINGFAVVLEPTNLLYCLVGVVIGMLIGVLPGLGPGRHHRHPSPADLQRGAGDRHHHAGRHLLRRPVRRNHHLGAAPASRRGVFGGDRLRRLPDGQAGQGRDRTGPGLHRLLHWRHRLHHRPDLPRPHRGELRPGLRRRRSTPPSHCWASCWWQPSAAARKPRRSSPRPSGCCWPLWAETSSPARAASRSAAWSSPTGSTSCRSPWASSASARSCTTSRNATVPPKRRPRSPTSGPHAAT